MAEILRSLRSSAIGFVTNPDHKWMYFSVEPARGTMRDSPDATMRRLFFNRAA